HRTLSGNCSATFAAPVRLPPAPGDPGGSPAAGSGGPRAWTPAATWQPGGRGGTARRTRLRSRAPGFMLCPRASRRVECKRKNPMAKKLTREEFLRNLSDSGLFSKEEMRATLAALPGAQAADGEALAQRLIAAGKLTPFQAAAVSERRFEELVIGNYQVLDRLGAGGMGTVYKARHRRMKRVVAIKVLSRRVGQSERFVQRFQREVEAVARLSHPNIVMAHDADEVEAGHFLVMEFVNGLDLATEVQKHGPLPVREAVECLAQAARGLGYAHGQGIIHRDIKPANLLRDVSGAVKVADLGL